MTDRKHVRNEIEVRIKDVFRQNNLGRKLSALNALGFALHRANPNSIEAQQAELVWRRVHNLKVELEDYRQKGNLVRVAKILDRLVEACNDGMELYVAVSRRVIDGPVKRSAVKGVS